MRLLLPLLLVPALWSRPISLYFGDIHTYYGEDHPLGNFYNGGPGGALGIYSIGGFRDAFVVGNTLHFPLHGPGVLYVTPGFHNNLTFQYHGYMPYAAPGYNYASLVLKYQGKAIQEIHLPGTQINDFESQTVAVQGVADEIDFGLTLNGQFFGNAGDLTYLMIDIDEVDPPAPQQPTRLPAQPIPAPTRPPAITSVRSAPSIAARPQLRKHSLQTRTR